MERLSQTERDEIAAAVLKALNDSEEYRATHCRFSTIEPAEHAKQHEDMAEVIEFFRNINQIKWDIPKTVVKLCVWIAIAAALKLWGLEWLLSKS